MSATRICAYRKCQIQFEPKRKNQRFHHPKCRMAEWAEMHPRALGKTLPEIAADQMTMPSILRKKLHCGHPGRSHRLAKLLNLMITLGACTTLQIQKKTGSMKPSTDVDDLRRAGYPVSMARYIGTTASGRKIFEYEWKGK